MALVLFAVACAAVGSLTCLGVMLLRPNRPFWAFVGRVMVWYFVFAVLGLLVGVVLVSAGVLAMD